MKNKSLMKRMTSFLLAVILLFSAIPVSLAVQDMLVEKVNAKIVREITELREESVKHFLCEDGSYIAATYSAPVHYYENGEWKEIDNSLSLDRTTLSESGRPTYTTKAGGLSVSVPQSFSDGQKITAQNKGYEIGFGLNSNQKDVSLKTSASVVELDALSSNTEVAKLNTVKSINNISTTSTLNSNDVEAYNAELMTVDNQSSAVAYKEIMPDTDFEYIVTSNSIKENIVVYEPQSEYIYSFDMDFDGLTPIVNPDNSISLIEPSNPDETIFFIEAPYMYDSNTEESIDIKMSLTPNGDEYVMTLVANADWINDPERVFPVVIDPTIQLLNSNINDVFVINGLYANSPRVKNEIRVGRNLTNITRTYVKITLPTIPTASVITDANFTLTMDYFYRELFEDDIDIKVYDCRNVAEWSPDTVSWNNQPFGNSANSYKSKGAECLDYIFASGSKTKFVFDITNAVQRWYDTGVNKGLMFASSDENANVQVDFHSSRVSDSANRPTMTFTYRPSGVDVASWDTIAASSTSQEITVTSSKEWLATTNQSWLTTTPSSGMDKSKFRINATQNTSGETRTGIVIVTSNGSIIGSVNVTQFATEPCILVDKEEWIVNYQNDELVVNITSNIDWNISIDTTDTTNWLRTSVSSGSGNNTIIISAEEYIKEENCPSSGKRTGKIIISASSGDSKKEILVTQYDKLSSYFNNISSDGTVEKIVSSNYIHPVAEWAMDLSYKAYNPIPNLMGQIIPGIMMKTDETAKDALESMGFLSDNISMINYEEEEAIAHVVAHRDIAVNDNETRPLIVVIVRGSVTENDWLVDFSTQFNSIDSTYGHFIDGSNLVWNSLYGVVDTPDNCEHCNEGCINCVGYLSAKEINAEPIILVTGHSLGAAVANLVAARLNSDSLEGLVENQTEEQPLGDENIYAYTFATPNVLSAESGEYSKINYSNIYNILNTNDTVPFVPHSFDFTKWNSNEWFRYGQDFFFTMPLDISYIPIATFDMVGLLGHSMTNYTKWMEDLPSKAGKNEYELNVSDLEELACENVTVGLLPMFFKAKCPVGVTLYDSSENVVAFETQEDMLTTQAVPSPTPIYENGVVSFITSNDEKVFFIPYGYGDVDACLEAYDYGTMTMSVGKVSAVEQISSKTFNNVSLYPGKEFMVEISEGVPLEDTQLFVTENGEIVGEITETNPPFKRITAEQTELTYETPIHFTIVTDQTVSEIQLHNRTDGYTLTLVEHGIYVSDVSVDGDNLIWTVGFYPNPSEVGHNIFDISVKSGEEWYDYNNIIAITVLSAD